MNIKAKLVEQLEVLENLQLLATNSGAFDTALETSKAIMDYIVLIDATDPDEDECPDCNFFENASICKDCEEAETKASLHQAIAYRCDLPIELVNRVMAGQDEVFSGIGDD